MKAKIPITQFSTIIIFDRCLYSHKSSYDYWINIMKSLHELYPYAFNTKIEKRVREHLELTESLENTKEMLAREIEKYGKVKYTDALKKLTRHEPVDLWRYQIPTVSPIALQFLDQNIILYTKDTQHSVMHRLHRDDFINSIDLIIWDDQSGSSSKDLLHNVYTRAKDTCIIVDSKTFEKSSSKPCHTYVVDEEKKDNELADEVVESLEEVIFRNANPNIFTL